VGDADPVRVEFGLVSRPAHQLTDRPVSQQDPPHLLFNQVRTLGTQDGATTQVGFDLLQPRFMLPSLVVGEGGFGGGQLRRVQDSW
jgi:hypothetical protein